MLAIKRLSRSELRGMYEKYKMVEMTYEQFSTVYEQIVHAVAPSHFTAQSVDQFLEDISDIFFTDEIKLPFYFSLQKTIKVSLLGMIITYKVINYTSRFVRLHYPCLDIPQIILRDFSECGIIALIITHIKQADAWNAYTNLKHIEESNFFLYPHKLLRSEHQSSENVKGEYIAKIAHFYDKHNNKEAIRPISHCIGELVMNFWAHATEDSETVVAARGNINSFNLVLADNGEGIISNLKPFYGSLSERKILELSVDEKVSSKKTGDFHMGFGLYYVSELAKANNGSLHIWSQGFHLTVTSKGNKCVPCGYWKGTIIELRLDLNKPKGLAELPRYQGFNPNIRINFGGDCCAKDS